MINCRITELIGCCLLLLFTTAAAVYYCCCLLLLLFTAAAAVYYCCCRRCLLLPPLFTAAAVYCCYCYLLLLLFTAACTCVSTSSEQLWTPFEGFSKTVCQCAALRVSLSCMSVSSSPSAPHAASCTHRAPLATQRCAAQGTGQQLNPTPATGTHTEHLMVLLTEVTEDDNRLPAAAGIFPLPPTGLHAVFHSLTSLYQSLYISPCSLTLLPALTQLHNQLASVLVLHSCQRVLRADELSYFGRLQLQVIHRQLRIAHGHSPPSSRGVPIVASDAAARF